MAQTKWLQEDDLKGLILLNVTDRSASRASVCRLLLTGDGVQNGFHGPWTTWNPPAPSNPACYGYTEEIQIDT